MTGKDSIKFNKQHVLAFKKAIDSLGEFGDLLCDKKVHQLKGKKEEVTKNLQPIKPDLAKFLKTNGFEIKYLDPIRVQSFCQHEEMVNEYNLNIRAKKNEAKSRGIILAEDDFCEQQVDSSRNPDDAGKRIHTLQNFYGFIEFQLNDTSSYFNDPKNRTLGNKENLAINHDISMLRIACLIDKLTEISNFIAERNGSYRRALSTETKQAEYQGMAKDKKIDKWFEEVERIEKFGNELLKWSDQLKYFEVDDFAKHWMLFQFFDITIEKILTWLQYHKPELAKTIQERWQQIMDDAWGTEGTRNRKEYSVGIIVRVKNNTYELAQKLKHIADIAKREALVAGENSADSLKRVLEALPETLKKPEQVNKADKKTKAKKHRNRKSKLTDKQKKSGNKWKMVQQKRSLQQKEVVL